ncbi:MAG: hypothetical protein AYL32_007880 [Candidatus Bathyarchaeota archaeon B26-2]|nr:MAG: hypothetical protein AYL32_007880 [Candidatus Bathyarchaeota archaeon B26-2]
MGYERALRAINLKPTDKIPLLGTIGDTRFGEKLTGIKSSEGSRYLKALHKALDVDMIYVLETRMDRSPIEQREDTVYGKFEDFEDSFPYYDSFHIAYKGYTLARTKTATQLWVVRRPFKTYKEMLKYLENYDPREDEFRTAKEIAEECRRTYRHYQDVLEDVTLVAGETYLTLFTFFIVRIGWQLLARLILKDVEVFDELARRYAEITKRHTEAWAKSGIKAFVCHDDVAFREGPVMSPSWFKEHVFPHYRDIWRPLKDKGIRVFFISDGNYLPLMDGLAEAGAEGFKVNPDARLSRVDIERLCAKYGGKKVLMLSPRRDVLKNGTVREAVSEVEFITALAQRYNGVFVHGLSDTPHLEACYQTWIRNREK